MLERFKELFSRAPGVVQDHQEDRVRLATCVLLVELANADEAFSNAERDHVLATLRSRFDLSEAEAQELITASSATRDESYDLWHFTRPINEACTVADKIRILEELWGVVYADGTLDAHEDYLVHKLAKLLNLNHPQLIQAKLDAKKKAQR